MALDWSSRTTHAAGMPAGDDGMPARGPRRRALLAFTVLVLVLVLVFAAFALSSSVGLNQGSNALASVGVPFSGGTIESVSATGPDGRSIPIEVRGGEVWPRVKLPPGEPVSLHVVMRRPEWLGWLAGSRSSDEVRLITPSATVAQPYLTLGRGTPLVVSFNRPVQVVAYGQPGALHSRILAAPTSQVTLIHGSAAGTIQAAAAPRTWETLPAATIVSWFPAGAATSAVASPRPGTRIAPATPIALSFSTPVARALGGALPRFYPYTAGSWQEVDSHTLVFHPSGYGFALGRTVQLELPDGARLVGSGADANSWSVPLGSELRAQQILAGLGYLPLHWAPAGAPVDRSAAAQANAAVDPPAGRFVWRFGDTPSALRALWHDERATLTRGALMAFENSHGVTTDGIAGPQVWHDLLHAAITDERSQGGYTFVEVSESTETLTLWHDGGVVMSTPVNTGIASAPTALGTYPVYEHIASGTMSGTNPDGSHYEDPGIPWISYFNGGDALHGFIRASYGSPQSLGCVEMPFSTAARVWPYTPIGTIVHIT